MFLQSAISPALLIVVTRTNGIDGAGLFSFAYSLSVILWAFGLWGGRTYQVSDVDKDFMSGSYIMVRYITSVAMIVGAVIFSLANGYDFFKSGLILLLVLTKALESISDALYGVLQVHGKLYVAGISLTVKNVASFLVFLIIDLVTKDLIVASAAMFITYFVVMGLYDWRHVHRTEKLLLNRSSLREYYDQAIMVMKMCWPVFIVIFLTLFSLNIPRYFLDMFHTSQVGYFGIMAMPITILTLFISFIIQPNVVKLSVLFNQNDLVSFGRIVNKISAATIVVGFVIWLATYLLGVWLLNTVFDIDVQPFKAELLVMVGGAIANALVAVYVQILIIMRRFTGQFYVLLLTNIGLVVLSAAFVSRFAMMGSVALFALSSVVQTALLFAIYRLKIRQKDQTLEPAS